MLEKSAPDLGEAANKMRLRKRLFLTTPFFVNVVVAAIERKPSCFATVRFFKTSIPT